MIEENIKFWQAANATDFEIQKISSLRKIDCRIKKIQRQLFRSIELFWSQLTYRV